ncbi:type VI secretion system contractile sheath small subunit [Pseudomonas sp. B6002]|uniref:type VI secretion system contractile sheath small subunit n=1 Tax=Pseudomonas sp. B6002 TaxID=2726978 RepID=UPI00210B2525|nr:type VI secretion system contractile sheath small subunit [Pseudomonas sp. B6002]
MPLPALERLMGLRDALVALKGPLADDPELKKNLQKHLFNEETDCRVLGKVNIPDLHSVRQIPFGAVL